MPRDSGFTLVEMLIVIVVLGVLAGIVVFAVGGIRDQSSASACAADRRTIISAIETYRVRHAGVAPPQLTDLVSGGYLRDGGSVTATSKAGEGYTLQYSSGSLSDCTAALAAGSGTAGSTVSSPTITGTTPSGSGHYNINGTGFVAGATVTLPSGIITSNVVVQNDTRIRIRLEGSPSSGSYPLTVTNPDGGKAQGTLVIA